MEDLEKGLEYWSAVEFDADGSGYSAGHTYFTRYEKHYIDVVPGALYSFINMLTAKTYLFANVNIWTAGKVIIEKSRGEVSLMEQITIENDSYTNKNFIDKSY